LELAEVQTRFPAITALQFPSGNRPDELWKLLWQLRDLFGRPQILEEDRLRAGSLRSATHFSMTSTTGASPAFIASVEPEITLDFSKTTDLRRAFELVNKTNQFNLNGRRLTESDWKKKLEDPDGFLLTVSYQDKFGPLGRIAVALGRKSAGVCFIDAWVLSCRAFSRLIEHQILRHLFLITGTRNIVFDYNPTARNGPLQEFFSSLFGAEWKASEAVPEGLRLSLSRFEEICPELPHRIKETAIASH
jgi:FkbH-like protein